MPSVGSRPAHHEQCGGLSPPPRHMKVRARGVAITASWLTAAGWVGLAGCGGGSNGVPSDAMATPDEEVGSPWALCEPGSVKECVGGEAEPTTTALRCNDAGDAFEEHTCVNERGDAVWCIEGRCAECVPGGRKCKDEDVVLICSPQGRWEEDRSCSESKIGDVCENGSCLRLCDLNKKLNSYIGCEYWATDLDNAFVEAGNGGFYDAAGAPFAVAVGNPNERFPAVVTLWVHDGEQELEVTTGHVPPGQPGPGPALDLSPIPPGTLRVWQLPRRDIDGTVKGSLAYRVESTIPVTAYQFNPLDNTSAVYSNDASLLLPTDVLGRYYIAMTREQTFANLRGFVTIVATADGTEVDVTVTAPTLSMGGFPPMAPGETISVALNRYEVFSIQTDQPGSDLTGTVVVASKEVAVFAGSEASNAPNTARCTAAGVCAWDGKTPCASLLDCVAEGFNTCCADHLEQQLFPVKAWGTRYIATQSSERGAAKDIWRVLAAENGTQVGTKPKQASIPVLNRGQWFEFESNEHFAIEANKPILVGQFLAAEDAPGPNGVPGADTSQDANIGDPAYMLAVPVEQYRTEYVVLAPEQFEFDYVNITAPFDAEVDLDGEALPESAFEPVSGEYRVARVQITDGEHRIQATAPVGVIVYGFDSYVSYGYPGGLNLKDLGLIPEVGPGR